LLLKLILVLQHGLWRLLDILIVKLLELSSIEDAIAALVSVHAGANVHTLLRRGDAVV
jgi:hypothetical protein